MSMIKDSLNSIFDEIIKLEEDGKMKRHTN